MRVISLEKIQENFDLFKAIEAVKKGFIAYEKGEISCPTPMQILFHNDKGNLNADCHVKSAKGKGQKYFVIKIASGFYENAKKGLDVNSGVVLVLSALTGATKALLDDKGWLTMQRTAAAGALAANLKEVTKDAILGIYGTGNQAKLQALYITKYLGLTSVLLYGRSSEKANLLKKELEKKHLHVKVANSPKELCHGSSIVVTTTPSKSPILKVEDLPEDLHIVALGADSPGKVELDPRILCKASYILTDDHEQCLNHGELGNAACTCKIVDRFFKSKSMELSNQSRLRIFN